MSASQAGFERAWGSEPTEATYRATVNVSGLLSGSKRSEETKPHVYVIRLADRRMTTATGRDTNVLYIGQGGPGRVNQLWGGHHSACKRLRWTRAAHGADFTVFVEVQEAKDAPLREVELLNAFLLEHGQMPALNSRHEGWLPARLLKALVGAVEQPLVSTDVYSGPRTRKEGEGPSFTAIDLYDTKPPEGKAWSWRGTLVWLWPDTWLPEGAASRDGFEEESFLLVGCPAEGTSGWVPVPDRLTGAIGWLGGAEVRARLVIAARGLGSGYSGEVAQLMNEAVQRLKPLPTRPVPG